MRNYFKALGLSAKASREEISESLSAGTANSNQLDKGHRMDAYAVLRDPDKCRIYADTVELYEALNGVSKSLSASVGVDSHRWQDRLSEFDAQLDTRLLSDNKIEP
jgi:DnaJ-class molecular chaperone